MIVLKSFYVGFEHLLTMWWLSVGSGCTCCVMKCWTPITACSSTPQTISTHYRSTRTPPSTLWVHTNTHATTVKWMRGISLTPCICLCLSLRLCYCLSGPPVIFPLCGSRDGPGSFSWSLHQRELHAALLQTAARQTHPAQRPGDHRPGVAQEPRLDIVSKHTCTRVDPTAESYFLIHVLHCSL